MATNNAQVLDAERDAANIPYGEVANWWRAKAIEIADESTKQWNKLAAEIFMNERLIEQQSNIISDLSDQLSKQSETGKPA